MTPPTETGVTEKERIGQQSPNEQSLVEKDKI